MFKKVNNKQLLLILIVLIGIYAIGSYIKKKRNEDTFHTNIIPKLDTNRVNCMFIYPKGAKTPIRFDLKGNTWMVSQDGITSRAEQRSEHYVIQQLQQISPDRLATNDRQKWKDYDATDSTGTRVVLLYGKDTALDVLVGRFSYVAAQKMALSAVRLNGQKEVYSVEGFLSMNITNEFNAWRDKVIIPMEYKGWTKLNYTYTDSSFSAATDASGGWLVDGNKPDSLAAIGIINRLTQQNYGQFVNKFDTNAVKPIAELTIADNTHAIVTLKAYPADSLNKYVITSTMNPGAYMSGARGGMFDNIFVSKKTFFKHPEAPKTPVKKKGNK